MNASNESLAELMAAMRHEAEWWAPRVPLETALTEIVRRADRAVVEVLNFPRFQGLSVSDEQGRLLGAVYVHNHVRGLVQRFADAATHVVPEPTEMMTIKATSVQGFDSSLSDLFDAAQAGPVTICREHRQPCLACIGSRGIPHSGPHRCCLC